MMCALEEDSRNEIWQDYVADMSANLLSALLAFGGNKNAKVPMYSEVVHRPRARQDNRTADEIKAHILKKLEQAG